MNSSDIMDGLVKLATIGSAIFVAVQAGLFKKDYNTKNDKSEVEKAIELSKFYNDNILLNKITYISTVFESCGLDKIIYSSVKNANLVEFDNLELEEVFGTEKLKIIENIINSIDLTILVEASKYLHEITPQEYLDIKQTIKIYNLSKSTANQQVAASASSDMNFQIKDNGKPTINMLEVNNEKYKYYQVKYHIQFETAIADALNLLEYLCMNFNTNIADEEVIYQSLHQTFFSTINLLYYRIANINLTGKDKYYTNIIKLYNKWTKRYKDQKSIEDNVKRSNTFEKSPIKR